MDPKVIRYITENRTQYTREAIDEHLLKAGHSRRDIDAAWSRLGDEVRPTPAEDRAFRRAFLGSVAAMYGITFLVYSVSFPFISVFFLIILLLAAAISIALARPHRLAASGMISGLLTALVIPFVFLVIVAGLCTALTGAPFDGPND
jgi:hypothetical protein